MSGGNKAIELQLQMRQNAEDMHSFMRELEGWEKDIKKKDEELRTGGLQESQVCLCCVLPSISGAGNVLDDPHVSASCLSLSFRSSSHLCATKTTKQR